MLLLLFIIPQRRRQAVPDSRSRCVSTPISESRVRSSTHVRSSDDRNRWRRQLTFIGEALRIRAGEGALDQPVWPVWIVHCLTGGQCSCLRTGDVLLVPLTRRTAAFWIGWISMWSLLSSNLAEPPKTVGRVLLVRDGLKVAYSQ